MASDIRSPSSARRQVSRQINISGNQSCSADAPSHSETACICSDEARGEGLGPIKPLARASAPAFERKQKRHELERRKEEAAAEKELRRDQAIAQAIAKAERSLEQASESKRLKKIAPCCKRRMRDGGRRSWKQRCVEQATRTAMRLLAQIPSSHFIVIGVNRTTKRGIRRFEHS
jgi:hypothetical protein